MASKWSVSASSQLRFDPQIDKVRAANTADRAQLALTSDGKLLVTNTVVRAGTGNSSLDGWEDIAYSYFDSQTLMLQGVKQIISQPYGQGPFAAVSQAGKIFLPHYSQPAGYHGDGYGIFIDGQGVRSSAVPIMDLWAGADWVGALGQFSDGSMVFTWSSERNGVYDVIGQNLNADGTRSGNPYLVAGGTGAQSTADEEIVTIPGSSYFIVPINNASGSQVNESPKSIELVLFDKVTAKVVAKQLVSSTAGDVSKTVVMTGPSTGAVIYESGANVIARSFQVTGQQLSIGLPFTIWQKASSAGHVDVSAIPASSGRVFASLASTEGSIRKLIILEFDPSTRSLTSDSSVIASTITSNTSLPTYANTDAISGLGNLYVAWTDWVSNEIDLFRFQLTESTLPTIQFVSTISSANEGNSGSTAITVQATLSAASTQTVTVPITYSGTATSGTDYNNASTSITIAAGQANGTASFSVLGDTVVEPNETVVLTLGTPTNAALGANITFTHTILNDDLALVPVRNGDNGRWYQVMQSDLDWPAALTTAAITTHRGLTGYLIVIDNAAENSFVKTLPGVAGSNFAYWLGINDLERVGTWKIQSGPDVGKQATFFDWFPGDPNNVGVERYLHLNIPWMQSLQWNNATQSTIRSLGLQTKTGYIIEYGGLPATYTITPSLTSVNEGSSVTFTIDTKNVEWGTTIAYGLSGISQADLAFGTLTGTAIVNQQGVDGRATVTVNLASDQLAEAETFTLRVDTATSAPVRIIDGTPPLPTVQFSATNSSSNEGDSGSTAVTVAATLSAPATQAVTLPISYSGTATLGSDYINSASTITISAGQTTANASFTVLGDTTAETNETVVLTIGAATNATLGSSTTFTHTIVNDDAIGFSLASTWSGDFGARGATSADLNSDGLPDVVATNASGNRANVYLANGDGTFRLSSTLSASGGAIVNIAALDGNKDGTIDLITADHNTGGVYFYRSIGGGTFSAPTTLGTVGQAHTLAYADFDKNGYLDIAASGYSSSQVLVVRTASGVAAGFAPLATTTLASGGGWARGLTVGDFNRDGNTDLVVTNVNFNNAVIFYGPAFSNSRTVSTGSYPIGAVAGDFNGDGRTDFTTSNYAGQSLSFFLQQTDGSFTRSDVSLRGRPTDFPKAADVDGDGNDEVIVGQSESYQGVAVIDLPASGGAVVEYFATTSNVPEVFVNDVNADGKPDFGAVVAGGIVQYQNLNFGTPTYAIASSTSSVNEGSNVTFTIDTKNVEWGKAISYSLIGISQADLSSGSLTGTAVVNQNGADGRATVTVAIAEDQLAEAAETLSLTVGSTTSNAVTVNDGGPIYFITAGSPSVNEGSSATFIISTTKVAAGSTLPYTLSGVSASDIVGGSLSGTTTIGSNGESIISIKIAGDLTTEPSFETLTISLQGKSASTQINDTSQTPSQSYLDLNSGRWYQVIPTNVTWAGALADAGRSNYRGLNGYLLVIDSSQENSFVKSIPGIDGSNYSYWLAVTDVANEGVWIKQAGPETGQAATYFDWATGEPNGGRVENYATLNTPWSSVNPLKWNDYSASNPSPIAHSFGYIIEYGGLPVSYSITPSVASVNEGSSVTFTIDTKNVEWGKAISYTLSGISQADLSSGSLSGNATVNQNGVDGRAMVTIALAADQVIEDGESLKLTVGTATSSEVRINDKSPVYIITAEKSSVDEGATATFNVATTNVPAGTSLAYTLSGVAAADILGQSLSGSAIVASNGFATILVPIAADQTTELPEETLTVKLQDKSASIKINDTSKNPDVTPPSPASFSPPDSAIGVGVNNNLSVSFSELISRGTGTVVLRTAAGTTLESFGPTSNRLTVTGSTLTIDPTMPLDIYSRYVVELGAGAVKDQAGNASAASSQYDFRTETPDGLYHFFVVAFGAAPGVTFMGQLAEAWNFGLSLKEIVDIFTTKPQFTAVYPSSLTNLELATKFVTNILKNSVPETSRIEGIADIKEALDFGLSRGDVIYNVFGNMVRAPLVDPVWQGKYGGAAKLFQNQLAVARYFTETLEGDSTNISRLQAVLGNVTKDSNVSSPAKIAQLLAQPAFVVSADKTEVREGSGVIFKVDSYGVTEGSSISYLLSGNNVTGDDISSGTLTGWVTLDSTGAGFITVQPVEDKADEETETLSLSLEGISVKTVSILDTTPTPDLTPPTVSSILLSGVDSNNLAKGNTLVQGNRVRVLLTMSEATTVIGTPSFTIDVGGNTKTALYASGSGSNLLTFFYTVGIGDLDISGGITAPANALFLPGGSSIKDSAGNNVSLNTMSITAGINSVSVDAVAPTVRSYFPVPGATNVAIGDNVVFNFFEAIKKGAGTILLRDGSGSIVESFNVLTSDRLTWGSDTLTIDPTNTLLNNQLYRVDFPPGGIQDEAGNNYAGTSSYNFTTIDSSPPTVSSILLSGVDSNNLAKGNTLVQGNRVRVLLTMSEATTVVGTPSFTIDVGGNTKTALYASGSGSNLLTFFYTVGIGDLDISGGITAPANALFLPGGSSIKDSAGNNVSLNTMSITAGINSVSVDAVAPTVRNVSPMSGQQTVDTSTNIVFTFSEAIKAGSGTIQLRDTNRVVDSFNVQLSNGLTWGKNELTLDPSQDLNRGTLYTLIIPVGSIQDEAGNSFAGIETYSFTTRDDGF